MDDDEELYREMNEEDPWYMGDSNEDYDLDSDDSNDEDDDDNDDDYSEEETEPRAYYPPQDSRQNAPGNKQDEGCGTIIALLCLIIIGIIIFFMNMCS